MALTREQYNQIAQGNPNIKPYEDLMAEAQRVQSERQKIAKVQQEQKAKANAVNVSWKNPEYVKAYITQVAKDMGATDAEIGFVLSIAAKESGFNPNAHNRGTKQNPENSYGIFQINTDAHPDYTGGLDPVANINYGVKFALSKLRQANGNPAIAARNYNGSGKMAEAYSKDFMKSYYPKYSADYSQGKIATLDPNQPLPEKTVDETFQDELNRYRDEYGIGLANTQRPYDPTMGRVALKELQGLTDNEINWLVTNYPSMTDAQKEEIRKAFQASNDKMREFSQQQIDNIITNASREATINPVIDEYDRRSLALQNELAQANPYTQLASELRDSRTPIDLDQLKAQQTADKFGASFYSMQNPNLARPDYAAIRQAQQQELMQAQMYNDALDFQRRTGLPMEYYLQGKTVDYNALNSLGSGRLNNYQHQQDIYNQVINPQAQQNIANITTSQLQQEIANNKMAEEAILNQQKEQLERMKFYDSIFGRGQNNAGTILNTMTSGSGAQDIANTQAGVSIYGTYSGNQTSRANTIENNMRALEIAQMQAMQRGDMQQAYDISKMISASNALTNAGYGLGDPNIIRQGAVNAGTAYGLATGMTPEQAVNYGQGLVPQQGQSQVSMTPFVQPQPLTLPQQNQFNTRMYNNGSLTY